MTFVFHVTVSTVLIIKSNSYLYLNLGTLYLAQLARYSKYFIVRYYISKGNKRIDKSCAQYSIREL